MKWYRSLEHPEPWDGTDADWKRHRRETREWWDNWEHNSTLSFKLLLFGFLAAIAIVFIVAIIATVTH